MQKSIKTELGMITYESRPASGKASTILCLPGFGWDSCYGVFKNILDQLPREVGFLAIDTIGTGLSIQDQMTRTADHILANLVSVLKAEKIDHVIVLAHSLGGAYALLLATSYPELVKALVLLEPTYAEIGKQLLDEVQPLIDQYPALKNQQVLGKVTTSMMMADVNPNNSLAVRQWNASVLQKAYASQSVLTEAQQVSTLIERMKTLERATYSQLILTLVTDKRYSEYLTSPFARLGNIKAAPGNHYLQWSNPDFVLEQLLSVLS